MNAKKALLLVLVLSVLFNGVFMVQQGDTSSGNPWIFPELGPAVVQDSYFGRAPGLESPRGLNGDLPGAYPIYHGNPLQTGNWTSQGMKLQVGTFLIAVAFGAIPLLLVFMLGRRSYGASKTR